jgi:hypothetical protein
MNVSVTFVALSQLPGYCLSFGDTLLGRGRSVNCSLRSIKEGLFKGNLLAAKLDIAVGKGKGILVAGREGP